MAVEGYDVSAFTVEKFRNLLQRDFSDVHKIRLTLRQASERFFKDYDITLGIFPKESQIKAADISFELVFCKDDYCKLPKNFPLKDYDIIEKVRN